MYLNLNSFLGDEDGFIYFKSDVVNIKKSIQDL